MMSVRSCFYAMVLVAGSSVEAASVDPLDHIRLRLDVPVPSVVVWPMVEVTRVDEFAESWPPVAQVLWQGACDAVQRAHYCADPEPWHGSASMVTIPGPSPAVSIFLAAATLCTLWLAQMRTKVSRRSRARKRPEVRASRPLL